jgi:hypothetical protein
MEEKEEKISSIEEITKKTRQLRRTRLLLSLEEGEDIIILLFYFNEE